MVRAICEAMKQELRSEAGPSSEAAVARILGESPQNWNRYVRGHVPPNILKVQGWLRRWRESGRTSVEVTLTGLDARVVRVS